MTDHYVLDSSVAVCWFLPDQESHSTALALLRSILTGEVHARAPRYMRYEFFNGLTKAFRIRGKSFGELSVAFEAFRRLPISYLAETHSLLNRAAYLAHSFRKAFYDMGYFALAEALAILVCTADKSSVAGLGPGFPAEFVMLDRLTV